MSKMARGRLLLSQSICTDFDRFFYDTVLHAKKLYWGVYVYMVLQTTRKAKKQKKEGR